jgi:ComF family protein
MNPLKPARFMKTLQNTSERLGEGLLGLLYPGRCEICSAANPLMGLALCAACASKLAAGLTEERCPRCASLRSPLFAGRERCQSCRPLALPFDRALAAADWHGPMSQLVVGLKFRRRKYLAPTISRYLAAMVARSGLRFDAVVPVPLHWTARLLRQFNQTELLAESLSKRLRLPVRKALNRRRYTPSQRNFSRSERFLNVHGAFGPGMEAHVVKGRSILLVDDIMTSGATAAECARTLKRLGAREVTVAVAARAPLTGGRVPWTAQHPGM